MFDEESRTFGSFALINACKNVL
uniref:Uncharacterized protein n=1 Tax=Anguilla anguilla TaxID=7936 RepID=A0A0E9PDF9_ANGAN